MLSRHGYSSSKSSIAPIYMIEIIPQAKRNGKVPRIGCGAPHHPSKHNGPSPFDNERSVRAQGKLLLEHPPQEEGIADEVASPETLRQESFAAVAALSAYCSSPSARGMETAATFILSYITRNVPATNDWI